YILHACEFTSATNLNPLSLPTLFRSGVTVKAIRFYERKRVLPPAKRAANRYRLYDDDAVGMLSFVKQATGLGLTLVEIKEIIARSEEHTSELQSRSDLVCRLLLEKKK